MVSHQAPGEDSPVAGVTNPPHLFAKVPGTHFWAADYWLMQRKERSSTQGA